MGKYFLSELKKGAGVVEGWWGVGTSGQERRDGGGRRREVPSVVRAVQSLGDNLSTGGSVVEVNLADVGPVSDGEDECGGHGRRAELGDGGKRRGHW